MGHVLMENRHGLVVDARADPATGTAEREAALRDGGRPAPAITGSRWAPTRPTMRPGLSPICGSCNVTPHVAQNTTNRRSAIDGRTTRHPGYAVSRRVRKRIEEVFGWVKTVGRLPQDPSPRPGPGRLDVHPDRHRLQSRPAAQAGRGCGVVMPRDSAQSLPSDHKTIKIDAEACFSDGFSAT